MITTDCSKWVFCCGMQRSGSTLQFQLAADLVEQSGVGKRVEWVKPAEFPLLREKYAGFRGWKVFKNHICTDEMKQEFTRHHAVGIYVYRDLRDAFVSIMRKQDKTFDQMWDAGFLQHCLNQYERWTSLPNVLVSKYEEMVGDLRSEVARIASHLGISLDVEQLETIAAAYSKDRQIQRISESMQSGNLEQGFTGDRFDPHTNLHTNHIHSGEIDGWRTILSAEQIAMLEDQAKDWLVEHGYQLSLGSIQRTRLKFQYRQRRLARNIGRVLTMRREPRAT